MLKQIVLVLAVLFVTCAVAFPAQAQNRYIAVSYDFQSGSRYHGGSLEAGFSVWRFEVPVAYYRYGMRQPRQDSFEAGLRFKLPYDFFIEGLAGVGREGANAAKVYAAGGGLNHYFDKKHRAGLVFRLDYQGLDKPHGRLADRARASIGLRFNF